MGLNIKNVEVERLAAEVARKTGETKTEAIRIALAERKARLDQRTPENRMKALNEYLEKEVYPFLPPGVRGTHMTREEEDEILGYDVDGLPG